MITAQEKENLIDDLLFHVSVINPLKGIVEGLEQETFRDCDFDWLITKRLEFTNLAVKAYNAETGRDIPQDFKVEKVEGRMNDRNKEMLLRHFRILQEFFKSYE